MQRLFRDLERPRSTLERLYSEQPYKITAIAKEEHVWAAVVHKVYEHLVVFGTGNSCANGLQGIQES